MDFFDKLMIGIENLGHWGYFIVFGIALAESLAFIGLFIPGTVVTAAMGFLAFNGYFNMPLLLISGFLGAVCGDGISFYLGWHGSRFFNKSKKTGEIRDSFLEKGKSFFEAHGGKSVFLGRFVGPLRPIIPFVAGVTHMKIRRFLLWNITSALLWSVFYFYLGYFFGEVWASIERWTGRATLGLLAIFAIAVIFHYYRKHHGKVK